MTAFIQLRQRCEEELDASLEYNGDFYMIRQHGSDKITVLYDLEQVKNFIEEEQRNEL